MKDDKRRLKQLPPLLSDDEAERFTKEADLSDSDLSVFQPTRFEFQPKAAQINLRVPQPLLDALKERARSRGIPYTRFIRELMEREVTRPQK